MEKEEVFQAIIRNLREILPELEGVAIEPQQSMKDLGANSIDRVDVVIQTMEDFDLKFPLSAVGTLDNIQGLVDFIYAKIQEKG